MRMNIPRLFKQPDHHGDACFATDYQIRKAGLMEPQGVLLGQTRNGHPIQAAGQLGAIVMAPPRSGKGVSFMIPNGLTWNESLFATDIKNELYQVTAQYRERHGQEVYRFDPTHELTARNNPLDFIPSEPGPCADAIDLITYALIPDPEKKDEMIWSAGARNLCTAMIYYLMSSEKPCCLAQILKEIRKEDLAGWAKDMIADMVFMPEPAYDAWNSFLALSHSPKTMTGIVSSLEAALAIFSNPNIANATSVSDFDLADLRKKKMSVYLCIRPADIERLSPLINIMIQQMMTSLLHKLPGSDEPYQVFMPLDEFPAFGKMTTLIKSIGYLASYNMIFVPIIQDWHQLVSAYGENDAQTILNTSQYQIYFNTASLKTAEMLSRRLGTTTERVKTTSRRAFWGNQGQVNESYVSKPLLSPSQIIELPPDDEIIIARGMSPIHAKKLRYYDDDRFIKRLSNHELQP